MTKKLKGKVVIVTGGATKIGETISKQFAFEGAKVVVCGFSDDPVERVVEEINRAGGEAIGYTGDISTEIKARECVTMAVNNWRHLDILVNAAGVFPEMEEMSYYPVEAFYFMLRNNIQTAFMMTRYALPELQKAKGRVILTGAHVGITGMARNAPYGGAKGFIIAFAKGLAEEQRAFGVRVFCICSDPIDSNWLSSTRNRDRRKEEEEKIRSQQSPEEIAEDYLFLASEEGSDWNDVLFNCDDGLMDEEKTADSQMSKFKSRESYPTDTNRKKNRIKKRLRR